MPREHAVLRAIARAEALLPGTPAPEGARDPRWQAIIRVGGYIQSRPEEVWQFTIRWGKHPQKDLRMAVACCLLEELLEYDFDRFFARVRLETLASVRFTRTFGSCFFGEAVPPKNVKRLDRLKRELERHHAIRMYLSPRRTPA